MVQEDQAGEPWSLYVGLYTVDEGFKAPPESMNPNTPILGMSHYRTRDTTTLTDTTVHD